MSCMRRWRRHRTQNRNRGSATAHGTGRTGWMERRGGGGATAHRTGIVATPPHMGQHGQAGEWPSLSDGTGDWAIGRRGGSCGGGSATAYGMGTVAALPHTEQEPWQRHGPRDGAGRTETEETERTDGTDGTEGRWRRHRTRDGADGREGAVGNFHKKQ